MKMRWQNVLTKAELKHIRQTTQTGSLWQFWHNRIEQEKLMSGTGVGIAAVYQDGLGRAPAETSPAEEHRGRLHPIGGENAGRGGRLRGMDEGQIQAALLFDARGETRRGKSRHYHFWTSREMGWRKMVFSFSGGVRRGSLR